MSILPIKCCTCKKKINKKEKYFRDVYYKAYFCEICGIEEYYRIANCTCCELTIRDVGLIIFYSKKTKKEKKVLSKKPWKVFMLGLNLWWTDDSYVPMAFETKEEAEEWVSKFSKFAQKFMVITTIDCGVQEEQIEKWKKERGIK